MPNEFVGSIVLQCGCRQLNETQCTQNSFEIAVLDRQFRQVNTWCEIELSYTVEIGGGLWLNHAFGTVAKIDGEPLGKAAFRIQKQFLDIEGGPKGDSIIVLQRLAYQVVA